ncbi:hypothetical protein [Streptomyces sp. NBC_01497]|uniref:hypothetical protein n=1 Tax=Streptomyces sp. NBC_01497 TaxID=2903885 RepID=UPI002E36FB20|nr:hypothetical protein [Streptomyces sp. NBC_01497]
MPSQYDVPGTSAALGDGPSEAVLPPSGATAPPAGPVSDEPGAAADPGATRHRSLVTVDHRLFLGAEAVTLATPDGFATVRFADATEVLAHPDGARVLTGPGGVRLAVEPTLYAMLTPDRIAVLDAAVDPAAVVRTPPRAAERIPRPPEPGAAEGPALTSRTRTPAPPKGRSRGRTIGLYLACVAVAGAALLAVHSTWDEVSSAHPHYTVPAMFWVLTAGLVVVARDLRNPPKDRTHVARWWEMQDHFKR